MRHGIESGAGRGVLDRGLSVLEFVLAAPRPVALADVVRATGLNRATAHRLLGQLVELGFVDVVGERPAYAAGPRLAPMLRMPRSEMLVPALRPLLSAAALATSETAAVFVVDWPNLVCADLVLTTLPVRAHHDIGDSGPSTLGAPGRAFSAFAPRSFVAAALDIVGDHRDADEFDRLLSDVARAGYATSMGELYPEMNGLAVPVKFRDDRMPRAVVGVSGPAERWTEARMTEFAPRLVGLVDDAVSRIESANEGAG